LRACGKCLTEDNIKGLVDRCEQEDGGFVTFDTFQSKYLASASTLERNEREIKEAFATFDDGTAAAGYVDVHTLTQSLLSLGDKLSIEQIDAFLSEFGFESGQSGQICAEDFLKVLAKAQN
jgi:Ca2+-binding EF-hand superfamily protein